MLKQNEIYSFKLISGEELIAKVLSDPSSELYKNGEVHIAQPVSIADTAQGVTLVPSLFTSGLDGDFTLNINTVSVYAVASDKIQAKYIEATTGIKVLDKQIILG